MPHTATHLTPVIQPQQVQGQQLTVGATTPIQSNPALQNVNLMQSLIKLLLCWKIRFCQTHVRLARQRHQGSSKSSFRTLKFPAACNGRRHLGLT